VIIRKKYLLVALPVVILFWWAVKDVPFGAVLSTLRSLSPHALVLLISLNTLIVGLFGVRWWLILRAQGYRIPYLQLVAYRLAAFGVAYFTPGPQIGGEPLQVHLLNRRHAVLGADAIASVTLDKALEWSANLAFLLIGFVTILDLGLVGSINTALLVFMFAVLFGLPVGYLALLYAGKQPVTWLVSRLFPGKILPAKWSRLWANLSAAETQVARFMHRHPVVVFQAAGLSILLWLSIGLEYWLALRLLGLNINLFQVVVMFTAARLAFLSPTPGGLGVLEAGQVFALTSLGLDPAFGIGLSLLIRARDLTLGGLGLWAGGLLARTAPAQPYPVSTGD
jgi:uncharacterized protein (TIRG00374 family)